MYPIRKEKESELKIILTRPVGCVGRVLLMCGWGVGAGGVIQVANLCKRLNPSLEIGTPKLSKKIFLL